MVAQMRLAVAGWSFGASGAIKVLAAHPKDVDELYWFDPEKAVARNSANWNVLERWLSGKGSRGPRFLRLMGGNENLTFSTLRRALVPHAKHFNVVQTMVADRFWQNSPSYRLAISVPPIPVPRSTAARGRFPEPISCSSGRARRGECEAASTPLSRDTGVFLSQVAHNKGVQIVGKDRGGGQREVRRSNLSLAELKGLLRFAFRSSKKRKEKNDWNIGSSQPLYESQGWNLAKLIGELERIAIGDNKFDDTTRHRWAVAGGKFAGPDGTPEGPRDDPDPFDLDHFQGFLQMCLADGTFPK